MTSKGIKTLIIGIVSLLALRPAMGFAAELRSYGETVRSFGMGGVRIANGDQATVMLWNPAGLSFVNGMRIDLFDIGLGTNAISNYQTFQNLGTISDLSDLNPLYGKPLWLGANGYAAFALPHFGFAVFDEGYLDATFNNPAFPELNAKYYNDYGYALGGSWNLSNAASIGLSVKRITRSGGAQSIGAELLNGFDTSTLTSMFTDEGVGYGIDAGFMYRGQTLFNPTFQVSWQNLGRTEFQLTKGTTTPDGIKDNITMGLSIDGDVGLAGLAAGLEYRHINDANEQLGKKIHMGVEVSLLNMDLRAGFYQGYTSYGLGLDFFLFQLDAALYSAERGAYAGQTQDQRIQVGISTSFGFDPNFNLISLSGKKRNLKQRR